VRPGWLWLLAVAGPIAGGLVASAIESDAWVAVTIFVWVAGPVAAFFGTWKLAPVHWAPRIVVSGLVGMAWSVAAILLWMAGLAAGEGGDF
jgi:hypothetical protein